MTESNCSNRAFSPIHCWSHSDTRALQWKLKAGPKDGKLKSIHALLKSRICSKQMSFYECSNLSSHAEAE